jgi:hypothetical protein
MLMLETILEEMPESKNVVITRVFPSYSLCNGECVECGECGLYGGMPLAPIDICTEKSLIFGW